MRGSGHDLAGLAVAALNDLQVERWRRFGMTQDRVATPSICTDMLSTLRNTQRSGVGIGAVCVAIDFDGERHGAPGMVIVIAIDSCGT